MDVSTQSEVQLNPVKFECCTVQFATLLNHIQISNHACDFFQSQMGFQMILRALQTCREKNGTVYLVGNGGSAAIASHAVIDFLNMAKMRASALLNPAVTTCISNDYGYEFIYSKQLATFLTNKDVLIAISSSGNSKNIINATQVAHEKDACVVTLSGFSENNSLRKTGNYNIWLDSKDYGQVEIGHAFILHYFTDCLRECVV